MFIILKDISECIWCNKQIKRGKKVYKLINGKFTYNLSKLITSLLCKNRIYCIGLKKYLLSFLQNKNDNGYFQIYCLKCGLFDLKYNSFGRIIKKPKMFYHEEFLIGSGFSGCDSYDRSYDRGIFIDKEKHKNINLENFIVKDDFVEYEEDIKFEESYSEEEEYSSESYLSDSESDIY